MKHILIRIKNNDYVKINLDEIIYISSLGDYCEIHLKDKRHVPHLSLKLLETKLPINFYRCHATCIVNLDKIEEIRDHELFLEDGRRAKVSQDKRKELMSKFNFVGDLRAKKFASTTGSE